MSLAQSNAGWSLRMRSYHAMTSNLAQYYMSTVPSEIDDKHIIETEYFLNEMYNSLVRDGTSSRLQEITLDALAKAGALSYGIKKHRDVQSIDFFRIIKALGKTLSIISDLVDEERRKHDTIKMR